MLLTVFSCTGHGRTSTTPSGSPASGTGDALPTQKDLVALVHATSVNSSEDFYLAVGTLTFLKDHKDRVPGLNVRALRLDTEKWLAGWIDLLTVQNDIRKAYLFWHYYRTCCGKPLTKELKAAQKRLFRHAKLSGNVIPFLVMSSYIRPGHKWQEQMHSVVDWLWHKAMVEYLYCRHNTPSSSPQSCHSSFLSALDTLTDVYTSLPSPETALAVNSLISRMQTMKDLDFLAAKFMEVRALVAYTQNGRVGALKVLPEKGEKATLLRTLISKSTKSPEDAESLAEYYGAKYGSGAARLVLSSLVKTFPDSVWLRYKYVMYTYLAVDPYSSRSSLLELLHRSPETRDIVKTLISQTESAIYLLLGDEHIEWARREVQFLERLTHWARARWPQLEHPVSEQEVCSLNSSMYLLRGQVNKARDALLACNGAQDSEEILEKLAKLEFWDGNYRKYLEYIAKLEKTNEGLLRAMGLIAYTVEALNTLGLESKAKSVAMSLVMKGRRILMAAPNNRKVRRLLTLQMVSVDLGSKSDSLMFRLLQITLFNTPGVDCSDYMQALKLLIRRGKILWALSIYNAMASRRLCSPKMLWYASLWMYLTGKMHGMKESDLAIAGDILRGQAPSSWLSHLRNMAFGTETLSDVMKGVHRPGHRCEAWFYWGLKLMGDGRIKEGISYLRQAMSLKIYNYNEHELAYWILRNLKRIVPEGTR